VDAALSRSQGRGVVRGASANVVRFVLAVVAMGAWPAASACTAAGDAAVPAADRAAPAPAPRASAAAPTWFHDVEPIVQVECAGCHVSNGTGGFPLDQATATSLASLVAQRVSARDMPPWPPGPASAPIAGSRALDAEAIGKIAAWAAAGAPAGDPSDHVERAPRSSDVPARPPELHLETSATESYEQPSNQFVTDEVRCFVLDLPAAFSGGSVVAARWHAGVPFGVHTLGGMVLGPEAATAARARSRRDGRAGFECGGGTGDLPIGPSLGASGSGGASEGATRFPPGTAVRIPAGGAVLLRAHYGVKHLANASDRSGVDLWLAEGSRDAPVRTLVAASLSAPVEVPCPSGVSSDPANPCSRENAFARLASPSSDAAAARARADALLVACGTTLDDATHEAKGDPDHFFVTTSCASVVPFDGRIHVVDAHMQTRGTSVRVDAEQNDGTWRVVLDIPRWQWWWEASYVLERGVPVHAGKHLRVSCTFDNGLANQWSALTGEPGHDGSPRPPLLPPGYLIAAPHRAAESCSATLGIERAPSEVLGAKGKELRCAAP
jgi:hypothetical protein